MIDDWPFFEPTHHAWAAEVEAWASTHAARLTDEHDADGSTRALAASMGEGGLLRATQAPLDVRALCIARDILARHSGLADFAFAMQGLGCGPMSLEQAIEAEAVAQALCMTTGDFRRAYDAFVAKQRPVFQHD